jgi:hypothetical protein
MMTVMMIMTTMVMMMVRLGAHCFLVLRALEEAVVEEVLDVAHWQAAHEVDREPLGTTIRRRDRVNTPCSYTVGAAAAAGLTARRYPWATRRGSWIMSPWTE